MTNYIHTKVFRLKTLTPVHISDGSEGDIIPSQYVISDSGQLHKINLSMLIEKLPTDLLAEFSDLADKENFVGIRTFIQTTWKKSPALFSDCVEYSMNAGDVKSYYDNLPNENIESQFLVTPFIRTSRKIFIPASSIKGSIRTAYICHLFKYEIDEKLKQDPSPIEGNALKCNKKIKFQWKFEAVKDPFKALKITDSSALSVTSTISKVHVIKKDKNGKFNDEMKKANIFAEFVDSGAEMDIEARLDTRYFSTPKGSSQKYSFEDIIKSCKVFYKKLLTHERDIFFKAFDKQMNNSRISELYNDFLSLNEEKNSFLIRLGKHSGRNSLSLNLINKKGEEPKSRKLIVNNGIYLPVGWVKVTVSE